MPTTASTTAGRGDGAGEHWVALSMAGTGCAAFPGGLDGREMRAGLAGQNLERRPCPISLQVLQ